MIKVGSEFILDLKMSSNKIKTSYVQQTVESKCPVYHMRCFGNCRILKLENQILCNIHFFTRYKTEK